MVISRAAEFFSFLEVFGEVVNGRVKVFLLLLLQLLGCWGTFSDFSIALFLLSNTYKLKQNQMHVNVVTY